MSSNSIATVTPLHGEVVPPLADLEKKISKGVTAMAKAFAEIGAALDTIRSARLYQPDYPTFDAYLKDRWGFTRARASQFIIAAETAATVKKRTQIELPNEGTARAVAAVARTHGIDTAVEVVAQAAAACGGLTAKQVQITAAALPPAEKKDDKPTPAADKALDKVLSTLDTRTGRVSDLLADYVKVHGGYAPTEAQREVGEHLAQYMRDQVAALEAILAPQPQEAPETAPERVTTPPEL